MKLGGPQHLTYCTNIHAGESWPEVLASLQTNVPAIKQQVSPQQPFGLGLRLSNQATLELNDHELQKFKAWLDQQQLYVFTLNGFPYGEFHKQPVKDQVHHPDWTTSERVNYTKRSLDILASLLPANLEGGISTSPLSYAPWHSVDQRDQVYKTCTENLLEVLKHLLAWRERGVYMHLDLEPEPDGLLEDIETTVDYYEQWLIPQGLALLSTEYGWSKEKARQAILDHIQVCYDVCHFAVVYESVDEVLAAFKQVGIKVGKIQISAALKMNFDSATTVKSEFTRLNEPTYLHQVVARLKDGSLKRFADLPDALAEIENSNYQQWRTHFHVPIFKDSYEPLQSTQADIIQVIDRWQQAPWSNHLEVETYTWEVLPPAWQLDLVDSISRELQWVLNQLKS